MQNLIGQQLAERYQIKNLIGMGGMAEVYLAWDVRLEREVAIKMIRIDQIPPAQQERILKRFEREAKALGKLNHPNIVSVYDFGKEDGRPYLVMEHLSGGTLKERIGEPMPFAEAARLLIPVAEALDYAHEHGIYHRDVKPANILLSETGRTKLTDFGIAKILETEEGETLTGTGVGVGTPEYMAPEQGLGQPVDGRTDEYALGVVLYELLTGCKPYQADTPIAVLVKQVKDPLPSVRELVPGLSQDVEQLLKKALAKQPDARFADMKTFGSVLTELISGSMQSKAMFAKQPIEGAEPKSPDLVPSVKDSPDVATYDDIQVNPELTGEMKLPVTNSQTRKWVWSLLGIVLVLGMFGGVVLIGNRGDEKASATAHALAATETQSAAETETARPTWTLTVIPTMTTTPTTTIEAGSISISEMDGMEMVYIPEGTFLMGSDDEELDYAVDLCNEYLYRDCQKSWFNIEFPQHEVYLDGYWIDKTEVTNSMYATFLNEMGNQSQGGADWFNAGDWYAHIGLVHGVWQPDKGYDDHPVEEASWYGAAAYCEWVDRRLPTEAEWEKAARGTNGQTYPWGNADPMCNLANYYFCEAGTKPVGSYPSGASPYGALDMAGNLFEWVADRYDPDYYDNSPDSNPTGPTYGGERVIRGGSWDSIPSDLRSAYRNRISPVGAWIISGFRCAMITTTPATTTDNRIIIDEISYYGSVYLSDDRMMITLKRQEGFPTHIYKLEIMNVEFSCEGNDLYPHFLYCTGTKPSNVPVDSKIVISLFIEGEEQPVFQDEVSPPPIPASNPASASNSSSGNNY